MDLTNLENASGFETSFLNNASFRDLTKAYRQPIKTFFISILKRSFMKF